MESLAASVGAIYPIRGTFFGCCAPTVCTTAKIRMAMKETQSLLFTGSAPSLDDPVRSCQHVGWNCESNLFRSLQVDHKLKLRRLLHRQISRFGTFQDFVHVNGNAPIEVIEVRSI